MLDSFNKSGFWKSGRYGRGRDVSGSGTNLIRQRPTILERAAISSAVGSVVVAPDRPGRTPVDRRRITAADPFMMVVVILIADTIRADAVGLGRRDGQAMLVLNRP